MLGLQVRDEHNGQGPNDGNVPDLGHNDASGTEILWCGRGGWMDEKQAPDFGWKDCHFGRSS